MTQFAILTNEELVRHADLALDPLTSTDLERELLRRLETLVGENGLAAAALDVLDDFNFDVTKTEGVEQIRDSLQFAVDFNPKSYRPLLDALVDHDIDTAAALIKRLELATAFESIANDAGDTLALLQDLITSTTTN